MHHNINTSIRILLAIVFFIFTLSSNAQTLSTTSKKAIRHFEEASRNFNLMYYQLAESNLRNALKADPQFVEAMMLLADVYKKQNKPRDAISVYQTIIEHDAEKYPEVHFFLGMLKFDGEKYSEAFEQFGLFLLKDKSEGRRNQEAKFFEISALFAIDAKKNPVPFSPENVGENINSTGNEYINAISSDELTLFFTGRQTNSLAVSDDFFVAQRPSTNLPWQEARRLGAPINTSSEEGALTITPDGRYILFAGCQWPEGFGSCDIYAARRSGNIFSEPVNLGHPVNTSAWESQPSLSSDGRTLYFASNRNGGFGKSDIWHAYLLDDGKWSSPQNMGETINTSGSEVSPFIHPDGQTLYFASDRHPGMGGLDLFVTRKDPNGQWSKPANLGFPINTGGEEINIVVNARGDLAYISSNRYGGYGGYDIFEFELYDKIRPLQVTYIKGIVANAITKQPLDAYFSLIDITTGSEIVASVSDERNGSFLVCIPTNRQYVLNVSKEGYLFYSDYINVSGIQSNLEPKLINIDLQPIEKGSRMVLRNIFFETDKYFLEPESLVELDKLLQFLQNNPKVIIEISGHTDNVGTANYNLHLSGQRAKAVYDYLIFNNIQPQRLVYKGYGFDRPESENTTPEGRALNRRTEIEILDFID